jgi:hypothetical protein
MGKAMPTVFGLVAIGAIATGCGGGGAQTVGVDAVRSCLAVTQPARRDAYGNYLDATVRGQQVRVWVLANADAGDRVAKMARETGSAAGLDPRIQGHSGNVVWTWSGVPTSAQDAALRSCIEPQRGSGY